MVEITVQCKECPFCHSDKVRKLENDKYDDMYFCEGCEHRFRQDPLVNMTAKSLKRQAQIQLN